MLNPLAGGTQCESAGYCKPRRPIVRPASGIGYPSLQSLSLFEHFLLLRRSLVLFSFELPSNSTGFFGDRSNKID